MNRRMFRAAMAVILSRLVAEERFLVVRQLAAERPKTAEAVAKLTAMNVSGKVLLVDEEWDENFSVVLPQCSRGFLGRPQQFVGDRFG